MKLIFKYLMIPLVVASLSVLKLTYDKLFGRASNIMRDENFLGHILDTNRNEGPEKRHIAYLKVHKAASSTMQNIFYRFGLSRNLSFVLPVRGHYISGQNYKRYMPLVPPYDNSSGKYDILSNHVTFVPAEFKRLMYDDAYYMATIREPLDRFLSAAYYYKYVYPNPYLVELKAETFINDLLTHPEIYEAKPLIKTRTFNKMAWDFGFNFTDVQSIATLSNDAVSSFVSSLTDIFQFVMLTEYFDESLVMMKRYLNWPIKDILSIKTNEFKEDFNGTRRTLKDITDEEKAYFRSWNRLDYGIYDTFKEIFLKKRAQEIGLDEEVAEYKRNMEMVQMFCDSNDTRTIIDFPPTKWNRGFSVDRHDCHLMVYPELQFCEAMKDNRTYLAQI